MKLTENAIHLIRSNKKLKRRLIEDFDIHPLTLHNWVSENKENNKLTTHHAIQVMAEETNLEEKYLIIT